MPAHSQLGGYRRMESGRYQARYRYKGQQHKANFDTEIECQLWLNSEQNKILARRYTGPTQRLFCEVAEEWLAEHVNIREGTTDSYRSILDSRVLPYFADRKLIDIDIADVRAFRDKWLTDGRSPATVKTYKAVLGQVFEYAIEQQYLSPGDNPTTKVAIKQADRDEMVFLNFADVFKLASYADKQGNVAIRTMAFTGIRAGELWDLKVKNLNKSQRRLQIVSTVREVRGLGLVSSPAPKTGIWRSVSVPEGMFNQLCLLTQGKADDDYVFATNVGGQIRHSNWRRDVWVKALKAAQLGCTPRVHDLRHTCAALYFEGGSTAEEVRRVLGHTSIQTTTKHYAHIWPDAFDRAVEGIDNEIALAEIRHKLASFDQLKA